MAGGQGGNRSSKGSRSPPKSSHGSTSSSSSSRGHGGGGGGGGGGTPTPPKGSPASRQSSADSSVPGVTDPYAIEKKLMRIKNYDTIKLPNLPKTAADVRTFRNSVFNLVCKMAKGDEAPVLKWIQDGSKPDAKLDDSTPYPILDRVLGSKLLELSKGTKFSMQFQSIQEGSQKVGRQPKGRLLLWAILEKYKMEKDKGVALTQSHLLSLKLVGNDMKALEDFRAKFDYIWQALEPSDRPSESTTRSHLFEQLKNHPKLQLTIDKFRNASAGSSKRSSQWLYSKLIEAIEIYQLEENSTNIEKSLSSIGNKVDVSGNPAKTDKPTKADKDKDKSTKDKSSKADRPDKSKEKQDTSKEKSRSSKDDVNAAPAKGKGKGKEDKPKKEDKKDKEKDKKRHPCMYYGYNACTKGDSCPYLHDPNNKYQGPKPKGLQKGSSSSAGAATVVAATCLATQVTPAEGLAVSSSKAPQQPEAASSPSVCHDKPRLPNKSSRVKHALQSVSMSTRCKSNCLPRVGVFEKAVKVFSAIAACVNPVLPQVNQEFLLDTGAGRNLISFKSMPQEFKEHVADAPEKVQFATGGGIRPSAKALNLQGELSGKNTFYALKDCPHALSVGIQVEQHKRPFVWVPGQLPYLIKADRIKDMVLHVPESAKIYASRVDENVPILSEAVTVTMAPSFPSDLPRSEEPLALEREALPHFGDDVDEIFVSKEVEREPGDEPLDSEDEESNPWVPSLRERLQKEAQSSNHALTHFPKNRYCEVCRRSKMLAKFHRRKGLEVDPDEIPPLHYGHRLRADHVILGRDLAKGCEGEQACLIVYDEYSGVFGAFPQTKRDTDANIHALQKFGGTKAHGKALCVTKSDTAPEIVDAIKFLGWLPDPSVPNDEVHNAKLERGIRTIKEGTRAILLKSGLPHEFWPRAIEYFCTAHSFTNQAAIHPNDSEEVKVRKGTETCYEAAAGETFKGLKLPFGCLVYYKPPKHRELPAFEPRTLPGIFVGWRIDAGYAHKGVHYILDYESLRTNSKGCGRPIQVYQSELVDSTKENWVFPLFEANMSKLKLFSERMSLPKIEPIDSLPFEGTAPSSLARKRRTYVTLERAIKYGKTPGCKGCEKIAEGVPHTEECHERFRVCLEEERLAAETRAAKAESAPPTPASRTPRVSAPSTPAGGANVDCKCPSCPDAPGAQLPAAPFAECHVDEPDSDFWMFDKDRKAWKRVHLRPRKRLFAPTGRDCPFDATDVFTERVTEWKCRGRISIHKDNWQKTPYQRISSKSWVGSTWFYPKKPVDEQVAPIMAMSANIIDDNYIRQPQKVDAMFASMIASSKNQHETAEFLTRITKDISKVQQPKDLRKRRGVNPTCFEFCCSADSNLGVVNQSRGINHFRLSAENTDMSDDREVDSLIQLMSQFPGADLFGSIPCGPWSVWQRLNKKQYGKKFEKKLAKQRKHSRKILANFIRCAEAIIKGGGHVAFEWPKDSEGWNLPELLQFCKRHDLYVAEPQGCAFGLVNNEGHPHLKTWRVVTSCWKLALNLDNKRCEHDSSFKHSPLEGSATKKSAFYTLQMAECISSSLYEHTVPAMPVTSFKAVEVVHERASCGPFAAVHLLLKRSEWHLHEGSDVAIRKELDGLLANEVWSYEEVLSRQELLNKAKSEGKSINIGRLMTILSVKNNEIPSLRKLKARIVFRGDDIRTEDNSLAVLQEARVNPTGITGLNLNLAYGACFGCSSTQSDVVRAYTQSLLKTQVETWVELPAELTPNEFLHINKPCVKLIKALYGHPESGWHWDNRFREVVKSLGGIHMDNSPSSFWFPSEKLLLTLYVDDIVLSGPTPNHSPFWQKLRQHLEVEDPSPVDRILGRKQEFFEQDGASYVAFSMEDFLVSSCEAYEELTKMKIKPATTPFVPEGSLTTADWESRGMLADQASRILMKILWAARLCRPDFMKAIGDLTKRLTKWSIADDRRLARLMGYVKTSIKYKLVGKIGDSFDNIKLCTYTDADHCSSQEDTKSTSGMIMTLEGPNTWWPLTWSSRKQTSTARSTTEAEMVSLGAGLFQDALPTQELLETIWDKSVELVCYQDNSAVIQIVAAGYSPKLRHLNKTFKINIGSISEWFSENSDSSSLLYIKTELQRADAFTKPLPVAKWPTALDQLGITST